jgi:hypothetical protein
MFSTLLNREFLPQLILFFILGVYFYFIDQIAVHFASAFLGLSFHYVDAPFLKLVYIVLGVVALALFTIITRAHWIELEKRKLVISSFLLAVLAGAVMSMIVHLHQIHDQLAVHGSLFSLEDSYWYYLHDYIFVASFAMAGFLFLRPLLQRIEKDKDNGVGLR